MAKKVKKRFFKKWWFWLIVIIVVAAFASGGEEEDGPTAVANDSEQTTDDNKTAEESSSEVSEAAAEEESQNEFSVGEAVQLGDNVLTVTEVEKSNGTDFDKPKSGQEYVIVHVKIDNSGSENISYNPFNFKMVNSQGQISDQTFSIVDTDTSLTSGELAPGGTVSGTIAFEQPVDDPGLQLQFEPSFWSSDMIIINLQ